MTWREQVRSRRRLAEDLAAEREYARLLENLLALSPYAVRRWYPRHRRR